ncbi:MAG: flagellar assembly peptidoglycan hydrolase FlgJ [Proteobacteria bacterium]|nr:flagellar assembly peptidoglycan hydrolase FlgJ [Pseudomonadota bacterium]
MTPALRFDPQITLPPQTAQLAARVSAAAGSPQKARATAEEFEAVFLQSMLQQMFTAIGNDGPLGSGPGTGVWRSFLTDEYAKGIAKAGGIGLSDQVYRAMIERQAAQAK